MDDVHYMKEALRQAKIAYEAEEVPIGCVIVCNDTIIAKAYNQVQLLQDPTAHAEILAITAACGYLGNKYLDKCTLYVTLEPCMMCMGAIQHAGIRRVVYASSDNRKQDNQKALEKIDISGGILATEATALIQDFFKSKRV